jgi:phospholipid/cholesterol/gamma-HCH transport system permease protein
MTDPASIQVESTLDRATVGSVLARIQAAEAAATSRLTLDLAQVRKFDSAGVAAILLAIQGAERRGTEIKIRGLSRELLDYFSLISVERLTAGRQAPARPGLVETVGARAIPAFRVLKDVGRTAAEAAHGIFIGPFRGSRLRVDRAVHELDVAANGAIPILILIGFLLGLILAMQAFVQLKVWGAELFIADAVGVSVTTEIGPLMTAILIAARSGSSMAAELGTMTVSEEVDALRQMGVNPTQFLMVPKVLALAITVPLLCVVFDVVAMTGSALFALFAAGIEIEAYLLQTQQALKEGEILSALLKSTIFGALIGIVACTLGFNVQGGSEGVGRATTNSVVLSIFLIIVVDAAFVAVQRMGV